eukprot:TRINITY_DN19972_c0_g1_i1.p2 TRINITY_DN19972_c0_g1~~TRINITY_DN19972_c0_g1_i1.p2  ORF type:complete len:129 (+),score=12.83 TRINITY_DN19972_c0_g1_i1:625-1011(+)
MGNHYMVATHDCIGLPCLSFHNDEGKCLTTESLPVAWISPNPFLNIICYGSDENWLALFDMDHTEMHVLYSKVCEIIGPLAWLGPTEFAFVVLDEPILKIVIWNFENPDTFQKVTELVHTPILFHKRK